MKPLFTPRVPFPEPDNGYNTAGEVLIKAMSLISWIAIWCAMESHKIERDKRREKAAAAADIPWDELIETPAT